MQPKAPWLVKYTTSSFYGCCCRLRVLIKRMLSRLRVFVQRPLPPAASLIRSTAAADCVFSHIIGSRSPILLFDRSSALLTQSAFRHTHISRQALVDASFASAARWRHVTLVNTTAAGAAAAADADALAGTAYFDDVTYATDDTGAEVPESADPATAVGPAGGAIVTRAAADADYDYVIEEALFDDDYPFGAPGGEDDDAPAADVIAGASSAAGRDRGWAADQAGVGGSRRLAEVEEVEAVPFLSPQDPWLLALREVSLCCSDLRCPALNRRVGRGLLFSCPSVTDGANVPVKTLNRDATLLGSGMLTSVWSCAAGVYPLRRCAPTLGP